MLCLPFATLPTPQFPYLPLFLTIHLEQLYSGLLTNKRGRVRVAQVPPTFMSKILKNPSFCHMSPTKIFTPLPFHDVPSCPPPDHGPYIEKKGNSNSFQTNFSQKNASPFCLTSILPKILPLILLCSLAPGLSHSPHTLPKTLNINRKICFCNTAVESFFRSSGTFLFQNFQNIKEVQLFLDLFGLFKDKYFNNMNLDIKIFNSIYFADQNLSKQDKSWNFIWNVQKKDISQ